MLNKDDSDDYTLQHQDGSDVTYDELDLKSQARSLYQEGHYGVLMDNGKYTIAYVDDDLQTEIVKYDLSKSEYDEEINTLGNVTEMNESEWDIMTSGEMELILYMIIPNNFIGVFYIHDGTSKTNNLSNDFVCTGDGSSLSVGDTDMSYSVVEEDSNGNDLPDYYTVYKIELHDNYDNFSTYTLSVETTENFTNRQGNISNEYGNYWLERFENNNNNNNGVTKLLQINIPCQDPVACNFNTGSVCQYPFDLHGDSQYNCDGSWTGPYCGSASACNTGSNAECEYPETDRVDCDGNNLYCEDSQACNYNELLGEGSCTYASDLYNNDRDCDGVCIDEDAINHGCVGSCRYETDVIIKTFSNYCGTVTLDDGVYTLENDVTFTSNPNLSLNDLDGYIFDGGDYTITYTGSGNWKGLFQPAKNVTVTIKNVNFLGDTVSIAKYCGGIIGKGEQDGL